MKICFIGSCGHAYRTYREMQTCADAEFVGIAPGSEHEELDGLERYGMPVFSSYEEMIGTVRADVAVISPVFGLTGKIALYCAERGIDIFCEKPIAADLDELDKLEKTVKEKGIHFSAMHFLRFTPSFYAAGKLVRDGGIGDVRLITAQKSYKYGARPEWYTDRALYTGTIPWIGIHAIDWIYYFTKKRFLTVSAVHCGSPEMSALCQLELEGDIPASVNLDYYRPAGAATHGDDRVRVVGTEGVIEVFGDRYLLINGDGESTVYPTEAPLLARDFLLGQEEITAEEIFMLTRAALIARESADRKGKMRIQ
ncbi:MAG: Gfo/Idh/MocA family oxidoreductase [Clostridia bacterium]|nr:Gfo/Idh/MocA family oxidoreductase [Clostridia bacterium]